MTCASNAWLNPGLSGAAGTTCDTSCGTKVKDFAAGLYKRCIDVCPTNYWAEADTVCALCSTSCNTCSPTTGGCETCDEGATEWLNPNAPGVSGTLCVGSCDAKKKSASTGTTKACLTECPVLQFAAPNAVCAACSATCTYCNQLTGGCIECNGVSQWLSAEQGLSTTVCVTSCGNQVKDFEASIYQSRCIDVCPAGQFASKDTVCKACDSSCLTCDQW